MLGAMGGWALYKRFATLNARNLLFHQAKLMYLERQLRDMEKDVRMAPALHSVAEVITAQPGTPLAELRGKHEEIQHALAQYNGLLLEQKALHDLPAPHHKYIDMVWNASNQHTLGTQRWLDYPENTIYAVWDDDRKPVHEDLVTLNSAFRTPDAFERATMKLTGTCAYLLHRLKVSHQSPL